MKIALISQEYPPETAHGGIASQTYSKAKGLAGLGHKVFVISRSITLERSEIVQENITVIRIPGMEAHIPEMTPIVQWITHSVAVAAELESLQQRVELDIVDFPEWAAEGYTFLLNRTHWKTIPVVIQLHGPLVMLAHTIGWPEMNTAFYNIGFQMEAACIQLADGVYSSSSCSADWVRSHYDQQKEDIRVIHLGIDTKIFFPQPVPKYDQPTILFVGKIVRNKGVEELIEAISHLYKEFPGLHLKLVGKADNKYEAYLKEKVQKLGIIGQVEFTGFINKEHLPEQFSKAHVFAAPSYYEGGPGFVYLEAMACGLPVIGCNGSGIDEIIQQEVTGVLVPPKDVVALTNALSKMLKDHKFSAQMGMNARDYILNECDSDQCLKKLENFYYAVIKNCSEQKEHV